LRELDRGEPLFSAGEAFDLLASAESAFSGMSYDNLGAAGRVIAEAGEVGAKA
jgi:hypothetical protein